MNELQRMQYLDAMGIEQFVPRVRLPGAALSRECLLPEPIETIPNDRAAFVESSAPESSSIESLRSVLDPVDQTVAPLSEAAKQAGAKVLEALSGSNQGQEKTEQKREAQSSDASFQPATIKNAQPGSDNGLDDIAQFSLAIWQLQDGLMIVDSHEPRSAMPTDRLLFNMLVSAGLMSLNLPQAAVLNWPQSSAPHMDNGWQAAGEFIESYMDAAGQRQPIQKLVLLGEPALKAVAGRDSGSADIGDTFFLESFKAQTLYLPSLFTILQSPKTKKSVWQGLIRLKIS